MFRSLNCLLTGLVVVFLGGIARPQALQCGHLEGLLSIPWMAVTSIGEVADLGGGVGESRAGAEDDDEHVTVIVPSG